MKKALLILSLLLLPPFSSAQQGPLQGTSTVGGVSATTQGAQSSNKLMGVIPAAKITVYLTGTTTLATGLTTDGTHALSNPFYSNASTSVNPGGWIAFAATGQAYDIVASSGQGVPNCTTAPLCYTQPVTLCKACYPSSASGGSGVTGTGTTNHATMWTGASSIGNAQSTDGTANVQYSPAASDLYVAYNLNNGALDLNANSGADFNLNGGSNTGAFDVNTGSGGFGFNTSNNGSFDLNVAGNGSVDINANSGSGAIDLNAGTNGVAINSTGPVDLNADNIGDFLINGLNPITTKSYAGSGTPTDPCSSTQNTNAIESNATPVYYKCDNSTGSYAWNTIGGGGGAVSSVSNSDVSLTISPTTGSVVASLNTAHPNTWTANQTIQSAQLNFNDGSLSDPNSSLNRTTFQMTNGLSGPGFSETYNGLAYSGGGAFNLTGTIDVNSSPVCTTATGCGGGSGTVNSGTSGQVAYYATTGTAVSGETLVAPAQGGTGQDNSSSTGVQMWKGGTSSVLPATQQLSLVAPQSVSEIPRWTRSITSAGQNNITCVGDSYQVNTNGASWGICNNIASLTGYTIANNYSLTGYTACNINQSQVFQSIAPTSTANTIYIADGGINDYNLIDPGNGFVAQYDLQQQLVPYAANTQACEESSLAWMGTSLTSLHASLPSPSGSWVADTRFGAVTGLKTSTSAATLNIPVTTTALGQTLFLFYRVLLANSGNANFAVSVDGTSFLPTVATTFPAAPLPAVNDASDYVAVMVLKNLALTVGSHTVTVTTGSSLASYSGTVNTSGTAVTSVSGSGFGSLTNNGTITIAGTAYTIASVNSGTSITLTTSAGTQSGASWSAGDVIGIVALTMAPTSISSSTPQVWAMGVPYLQNDVNSRISSYYNGVIRRSVYDMAETGSPSASGPGGSTGLAVNYVDVRNCNFGTPVEMSDQIHPSTSTTNPLNGLTGFQEDATCFIDSMPQTPIADYAADNTWDTAVRIGAVASGANYLPLQMSWKDGVIIYVTPASGGANVTYLPPPDYGVYGIAGKTITLKNQSGFPLQVLCSTVGVWNSCQGTAPGYVIPNGATATVNSAFADNGIIRWDVKSPGTSNLHVCQSITSSQTLTTDTDCVYVASTSGDITLALPGGGTTMSAYYSPQIDVYNQSTHNVLFTTPAGNAASVTLAPGQVGHFRDALPGGQAFGWWYGEATSTSAGGSGTVTSSGSPVSGNIAQFTSATNIAPASLFSEGTFTTGTTAVSANTCTSASTVSITGVTTSSVFIITASADTSSLTGWGTAGGLVLDIWPTSGTLNYKVCNQTASSITPSSATWNYLATNRALQ